MSKTIMITGASSGFGRETAKIFHQQGWNVVATMRSPENEQELNELENVLVTYLDVQQPESIQNTIIEAVQHFGSIDVLLNNAGYGLMGVFESATSEQIQKQYAVNVFGLMDVTRAVLPQMRRQGSGTIINLSSFGGQVGLPFGSLYNSSKFAVEGFSESLSHELYALGIAVKLIEPGGVDTNFRNGLEMIKNEIPEYQPLMGNFFGRYAQATAHLPKATAEDIAQTIYEAATDGKAQLRYVIGEDAQFYIDTKFKNSDPDFIKIMRDRFINQ
ncbi:NAD(P)-dependent dehydrogenase (short-subunit alcohol dehydrogenase family) [Pedobacter cryoconitis]|uniref:NAD(P)-dependent dehydrogenase (Short-subunit alcohol dehydrogenase family) n=1 Tax=Pedobacter cryoconitis TaxID=188932 RepID=A0A7W9DIN7_9SPHI|nr:SDR family oxidoreductase [Pedobacter cryoconitis]MBB5620302.1 NAD(P)-dependent dehydrogenase (short-subunit alcohol dehydrogenase family) [Pedobacter cryoconitis]